MLVQTHINNISAALLYLHLFCDVRKETSRLAGLGKPAQQRVSAYAAPIMNSEQINRHEKIFDLFSQSQTKTVEVADLNKLLLLAGHTVTASEVEKIASSICKERITLDEFLDICSKLSKTDVVREELKKAFRVLDSEDNGYVSVQQLVKMLQEGENKLSTGEIEELVEILEPDANGYVNYGAFIKSLYNHSPADC